MLVKGPPLRIISSPATRCIQTLGPTADAMDLEIELWDGLGPDADSSNLVDCLANPSFNRAVLCTHGEVMGPLLELATFRAVMDSAGLSRRTLLTKGSGWRLRVTPKGKVIGFKHLLPGVQA